MTQRLRKPDVERLLDRYDADPVGALTDALRIVLQAPDATWAELVSIAPISGRRALALTQCDAAALDALAAELNELRTL